ncbi:type II secretion system protein N [Novosphingobium cyanobacteriorum]|uniref:Type II secretion system protein N n=1 Tax=Novosphingobium cyanobacteriorum TaxID=3024215 RepID=A0ABT6CFK7_9SPHN|nr:type II secretion system protein N [Novosphingobium cyanobacteriorum]MDF8332707.1 type II secretion system protein N [Novosphingobium cyanobacteriorum]
MAWLEGFGSIRGFALPATARAPSLHALLWWLLAAVNGLLAAALVWSLVTPVSPLGNWTPATVRVIPPAQRATLFASVDPFNRGTAPAAAGSGGGAVTSLTLTLFATRASAGGQGSAIIAGADGVQQVYRTGTEVQPGVTLTAVAFDHVELTRNGAHEMLYIDQSDAAPSADGIVAENPVAAPAAANGPDAALTVDAVRRGIGFGPRGEGGRVVGLEVMPQGDGAAFRAAGFQPGDVVTTVAGRPISGPADAAQLAAQLRPGASIAVTVRRGNRNLPLAISLAP